MEVRTKQYRNRVLRARRDHDAWRVSIGGTDMETGLHADLEDAFAEAKRYVDHLPIFQP
ncbi:MAG TPA: hypothetical protein VKZ79_16840 [Alphaproteobacteria bacterium]|nr:hypothetical protein [Alphaproteobacteria bacterium]